MTINPPSFYRIILSYTGWWVAWFILQSFVLHRLHLGWDMAIWDAALTNLFLALVGYVILNTYRFYSPGAYNYFYRLGHILVLTLISLGVSTYFLRQLNNENIAYLKFLEISLPVRFMFSLLMVTFIAVFSGLRFYMKEQQEIKTRKDEAELLVRDAELDRLRQQLQPHFLFNSLNSISALAVSQPQQARLMIQQLSDFLRGTLNKGNQHLVRLEEELEHLKLYLDIEKVRFGHRLKTNLEFDTQVLNMILPSLLLQPIVENAIKFGLYDTIGEITISIHAAKINTSLKIEVKNPFDPVTAHPKKGNGFGLNSVQRRLYLLFGRNDLLSTQQEEGVFTTSVLIPQAT